MLRGTILATTNGREDDMKTHIADIIQVIQLAVAPVFLLGKGSQVAADSRQIIGELLEGGN